MELVQPTLHDNTFCSPSNLNVVGDTTTSHGKQQQLCLVICISRYFVLCFINTEVMCHLVLYLLCQWLPMDLHTVAIGLYNKDTCLGTVYCAKTFTECKYNLAWYMPMLTC